MTQYVYHGSQESGIARLRPVSPLHGSPDTKVIYLSGSAAYSLFYIWDGTHNLTPRKHVTCALKDGVVQYQEQFPGQLRAFYQGVSGYLYRIEKTDDMRPVANREDMWACMREAPVAKAEFIPDVYERIMLYVREGVVRVTQADDDFRTQLDEHLAQQIRREGLLREPDSPDALFYARFFPRAWSLAQEREK